MSDKGTTFWYGTCGVKKHYGGRMKVFMVGGIVVCEDCRDAAASKPVSKHRKCGFRGCHINAWWTATGTNGVFCKAHAVKKAGKTGAVVRVSKAMRHLIP